MAFQHVGPTDIIVPTILCFYLDYHCYPFLFKMPSSINERDISAILRFVRIQNRPTELEATRELQGA